MALLLQDRAVGVVHHVGNLGSGGIGRGMLGCRLGDRSGWNVGVEIRHARNGAERDRGRATARGFRECVVRPGGGVDDLRYLRSPGIGLGVPDDRFRRGAPRIVNIL